MKKFRGASFGLVIASLGLGLPTGALAAGCSGPSTNAKYCQQAPGSYELAYDAAASNGIRLDALKSGILFKSYLPPKFLGNNSATTAFFIPQATRTEFNSFLNNKPTVIAVNDAVVPGTVTLSAANCPGGSDLTWTLKAATAVNGSVLTVPNKTLSVPPSRIIVDRYTLNDGTTLSIGTTAIGSSEIEWTASRTETASDGTIQVTKFIQDQQITFAPTSLKSAGWCWTASGLTNNCTTSNADGYYWSGTKPTLIPTTATFPAATLAPNTNFYYSINNGAWQTGDCASKTPQNGQCGAAQSSIFTKLSDVQARTDLCSVGSPQNIRDAGNGIFKWNCTGVNGGTTSADCVSSSNCWTCGTSGLFGLGCKPTAAQFANMCGTEAIGYMYDLWNKSGAATKGNNNTEANPAHILAETQIPNIKLFVTQLNMEPHSETLFTDYKNQWSGTSGSLGYHQTQQADWFAACYDARWIPATSGEHVFVAQGDDVIMLYFNGDMIGEYGGGYVPGVSKVNVLEIPYPIQSVYKKLPFYFNNVWEYPTNKVTFEGYPLSGMDVFFSQHSAVRFLYTATVTQDAAKSLSYPVQIRYIQAWPTGIGLRLWAVPAAKFSSLSSLDETTLAPYLMKFKGPTAISCPHQAGQ